MSILLRSLQNKCISTLQPSVEGLTAYRYGSTHALIITSKGNICNIQKNNDKFQVIFCSYRLKRRTDGMAYRNHKGLKKNSFSASLNEKGLSGAVF